MFVSPARLLQLPSEGELQLMFARFNMNYFAAEIPAYRIVYNRRLTTVAGRISYRPRIIELSQPLLAAHPHHVQATLLHEMVHAWLFSRHLQTGHGPLFKRKMNEVGLPSIYHQLPVPRRRSSRRYVLECPRCKIQLERRRRPGARVSCARCSPRRFDARVEMLVRPWSGRPVAQARPLHGDARLLHGDARPSHDAERR